MNSPIDMSQFIAPKSDQMNADDLIGGPRTIRIRGVRANEGSPEQPVSIFFDGDDGKPYKPCKSMRRLMVAVWGKDANAYVGRAMTLYRDPKVQFGGMAVGGIRISHMTHLADQMTVALTATKGKRAPHVVRPLDARQIPNAGTPSAGAASPAPDAGDSSHDAGQTGAASTEEPSPFDLQAALRGAATLEQLASVWNAPEWKRARKVWDEQTVAAMTKEKDNRKRELSPAPADVSGVGDADIPF